MNQRCLSRSPWGVQSDDKRATDSTDETREEFDQWATFQNVMKERILCGNFELGYAIGHVSYFQLAATGEGSLEHSALKRRGATQVCVNLGLDSADEGEAAIDFCNDSVLFGERWQWKRERSAEFKRHVRLPRRRLGSTGGPAHD
jgi:hypothetical protein